MVQETSEIEIVPAIIPESLDDLREKLSRVARLVPTVHIDILDGDFTDKPSWPYSGLSKLERAESNLQKVFVNLLTLEDGLPFWDSLNFEFHLMVANPIIEVEHWITAGAMRIMVHYEAVSEEGLVEVINLLNERGVEAGLVLDIETPLEVVEPFREYISNLQLMAIDRDGFQGQPFDDRVIERVREARELYPEMQISVDGGINLENASDILDAGADRLIVGSALFDSVNIADTLDTFQSL